jgi:hypothetical protein
MPSEDLSQALRRAVETTATDERGVEGADERLRGLLARIGVQSNHYHALAGGRLRHLEQRLAGLEDELDQARRERQELDALAAEEAARSADLERLGRREVALRQALLRVAAQELESAQLEATRLEEIVGSAPDERTALPSDLPGRVASARDALRGARGELELAASAVAGVRHEVESLHERRRAADAELETFAAWAEVSTEVEEEVRTALGNLRGAPAAAGLPEVPAPRDPLLGRFRQERTPLETPPTAATHRGSRAALRVVAAVLVAAGVVVGVVVQPAAFLLVLIAAVVLLAGRGRGTTMASPVLDLFEGRAVGELAAAAEAEDRAWISYEGALAEHERFVQEAANSRHDADSTLRALLDKVSPGSGDTENRATAYLQQCARHRSWIDARAQVELIAADQRTAAEPERRSRTATEMVERTEAELRRLLGQADIAEDRLDAGLASFEQLLLSNANAQEDVERRAGAAGRLEHLLAGRTLGELGGEATRAQALLVDHEAKHPGLPREPASPDADRQLADERTRLAQEVADLAARRDEREPFLPDSVTRLTLSCSSTQLARSSMNWSCSATQSA